MVPSRQMSRPALGEGAAAGFGAGGGLGAVTLGLRPWAGTLSVQSSKSSSPGGW